MKKYTVGSYSNELICKIDSGIVGKDKGGVAFDSTEEAIRWGKRRFLGLEFQVYELLINEDDFFVSEKSEMFPTLCRLTRLTKIKYVQSERSYTTEYLNEE